jgi:hypothetical protein
MSFRIWSWISGGERQSVLKHGVSVSSLDHLSISVRPLQVSRADSIYWFYDNIYSRDLAGVLPIKRRGIWTGYWICNSWLHFVLALSPIHTQSVVHYELTWVLSVYFLLPVIWYRLPTADVSFPGSRTISMPWPHLLLTHSEFIHST